MISPRRSQRTLLLAVLVALVAPACSMPRRSWQPPVNPNSLDDTSFLHYLATAPVVTVDEGMRAVLAITGPTTPGLTFEERSAALSRLGAVKAAWQLEADQILDKGTLAHMLRVICALPKGLSERLSAVTKLGDRRHALRTCVHEGLLPAGLASEPVTGGELLTAITTAEKRLPSVKPEEP